MKIVKQSVELLYITPYTLEIIERIGRVCYKSEDKIMPGTAVDFVKARMNPEKPHMAMLEFGDAIFKVICDRGVSHEIVRHRLGSYAQESTRYCNYSKGKFDGEITVIEPPIESENARKHWRISMLSAEISYMEMLKAGCSPQIARSVLPNSLKTEIVVKYNFREWKHFFSLRAAPAAHPQMQEVAKMMQNELHQLYPLIF